MKILYYIYGLNVGGAETFIYSVLSSIDTNRYHIDFVLQSHDNRNERLLNLCDEKDAMIHYVHQFHKALRKNIKETEKVIKDGNYDLIHIHQNAMINVAPIIAARKCRVPVIMHSHNSLSNAGKLGMLIHKANRTVYASKVIRLACGKEAGKWMFGKQDFQIISNAISLDRYAYSEEYRSEVRNKYSIANDTKVIGHIGRFVAAKNHDYILDIFKRIEQNQNVVLLLVGDGELKKHIIDRIKSEKLTEKVILTGNVDDAYRYYSAFDVLLFPSIFEGLPFTLVEAQASGLSCLVSNNVTKDVKVLDCIKYIDLESPITVWENELTKYLTDQENREEKSSKMWGSVYDVNQMIIELEKQYDLIGEKGYI